VEEYARNRVFGDVDWKSSTLRSITGIFRKSYLAEPGFAVMTGGLGYVVAPDQGAASMPTFEKRLQGL